MYSTSVATTSYKRKFKRTNNVANKSNTRAPGERSTEGSEQGGRSVPINTVHFETRGEKSTCIQSQITEPLRTVGEIQIGGLRDGSNSSPPRRLPDETRLTGRIFHGPHTRPTQEIPEIAISGQNLRIPVPSVRPIIGSKSIHKVVEAGGSRAAFVRYPNCDLLRRPSNHAPGSTGNCQDFQHGSSIVEELGISDQSGKMLPLSDPSTCILRSPPGFQETDHCRTDEETSRPTARECQCGKERSLLNARISFDDWSDEPDGENRYPPSQMARIGIHQAPLHYRALQRAYIGCLHKNGRHTRSQHVQVSLNLQAVEELQSPYRRFYKATV